MTLSTDQLFFLPLLILLNLLPIAGVVLLDWEVFHLIFLYWLENLFVGFFMIVRMIAGSPQDESSLVGRIALALFFSVHYGMFCAVHGIFIFTLFGDATLMDDSLMSAPLAIPQVLGAAKYLLLAAFALFLVHLSEWLVERLDPEFTPRNSKSLVTAPYKRIVILHLTILLGGFLLQVYSQPLAGLLLLVLLKTGYDVFTHLPMKKESKTPA